MENTRKTHEKFGTLEDTTKITNKFKINKHIAFEVAQMK